MAHLCWRALPASQQVTDYDDAQADELPIAQAKRTNDFDMEVDQYAQESGAAIEGMHASMGGHAQPAKRPLRTASPLYAAQVSRQSEILAVLLQYYGSGAREQKFPVLSAFSAAHRWPIRLGLHAFRLPFPVVGPFRRRARPKCLRIARLPPQPQRGATCK